MFLVCFSHFRFSFGLLCLAVPEGRVLAWLLYYPLSESELRDFAQHSSCKSKTAKTAKSDRELADWIPPGKCSKTHIANLLDEIKATFPDAPLFVQAAEDTIQQASMQVRLCDCFSVGVCMLCYLLLLLCCCEV